MDQPASFGRRTPRNQSAPFATQTPAPSAAESASPFALTVAADLDSPWLPRVLIALLSLPFLILLIDGVFSGTELITPIDHQGLVVMRVLGGMDGLLLWIMLHKRDALQNLSMARKVLVLLFLPLIMVATFDALSWRLANWGAFGWSDAPFETATYPIKSVEFGRKGRRDTIELDPFEVGESSHIPIPHLQYASLRGVTEGQCVTVQQRRSANGAIQIRTDGEFTLNEPEPVQVTSC